MNTWLRAAVVVDVSSVAHAIGGVRGHDRTEPDLARVTTVLRHVGIEPVEFLVAVPGRPVTCLGRSPHESRRTRDVARAEWWVREQSRGVGVPVRAIEGASDGWGEVAVDDVAVAIAIDRGIDISEGRHALGAEGLVILSSDEDLEVVGAYTPDVVAYIVRPSFSVAAERRAVAGGNGTVALGEAAYDNMARGATRDLPANIRLSRSGLHLMAGDDRISSSLAVEPGAHAGERATAVEGVATVAIVDAYGLANGAARAIGAGRLPIPDTVRDLLLAMRFPEPFAQIFVVPDVPDHVIARVLAGRRAKAWRTQDQEFEQLLKRLENDEDERTVGAAARIAPERSSGHDPVRRQVVEKRATSLLTADLVHVLHRRPDAHVVALSDRPEIDLVLHELAMLSVVDTSRVTRVGLHPRPVVLHTDKSGERHVTDRHNVAVLTAGQAAKLTRVEGQAVGADLRAALPTLLGRREVMWQVIGYDATANGVVVRAQDDPVLHVTLCDFLALDDQVVRTAFRDGLTTGGGMALRLSSDPARPCALPALWAQEGSSRGPSTHYGRITEVLDDGRVRVDIDADGLWDAETAPGHETTRFRAGETVAVHQGEKDDGWVLLSGAPSEGDECSHPFEFVADGATGRLLDGSHTPVPVQVLDGLPHAQLRSGDRGLCVLNDDGQSMLALSTPLPHLQALEPPKASTVTP